MNEAETRVACMEIGLQAFADDHLWPEAFRPL
jgi:hypothetical protein